MDPGLCTDPPPASQTPPQHHRNPPSTKINPKITVPPPLFTVDLPRAKEDEAPPRQPTFQTPPQRSAGTPPPPDCRVCMSQYKLITELRGFLCVSHAPSAVTSHIV
ncbi:Glutathione synthetase [Dissostichus eleginoides]|uniref:Glutathione synthetase n=1 Tax=Dissostichus eleginoides TaxID=100907 RepID=A0AAD9ES10_DISEL|nr:Glutathione synthetase [Dissostichus eleginoides]